MTTRRSACIVSSLLVTLVAALVFVLATDGFYGTTASSLWDWDALHPRTMAQSDDVYLCSNFNGEGADDALGVFLVVLLLPSLIVRILLFRRPASWAELVLFASLSTPALVFHFTVARCADIDLTLVAGRNLPLAALVAGWLVTFVLLLLPRAGVGSNRT